MLRIKTYWKRELDSFKKVNISSWAERHEGALIGEKRRDGGAIRLA